MSDPTYIEIEKGRELLQHVFAHIESKLPSRHIGRWCGLIDEGFEVDQALDVLHGELTDDADRIAVEDARRFWQAFQTL